MTPRSSPVVSAIDAAVRIVVDCMEASSLPISALVGSLIWREVARTRTVNNLVGSAWT